MESKVQYLSLKSSEVKVTGLQEKYSQKAQKIQKYPELHFTFLQQTDSKQR